MPVRLAPRLLACSVLVLLALPEGGWARIKRIKPQGDTPEETRRFKVEADESVAEQLNDPTSFLRELRLDLALEHGTGRDHTTLELAPTLALPLSERLRFEGGIPLLINGPGDRNDLELGDIFGSISYIFHQSESYGALLDFRLDLPTGNEKRGAGLSVTQWHASLGSVLYTFEKDDILIIPFLEYRRSLFGNSVSPSVSHTLGTVGLVYLWSDDGYLRSDWTLSFDTRKNWRSSGLLNLEIGQVFQKQFALVLGYEFDLWGDAAIRNQATFSVAYLF